MLICECRNLLTSPPHPNPPSFMCVHRLRVSQRPDDALPRGHCPRQQQERQGTQPGVHVPGRRRLRICRHGPRLRSVRDRGMCVCVRVRGRGTDTFGGGHCSTPGTSVQVFVVVAAFYACYMSAPISTSPQNLNPQPPWVAPAGLAAYGRRWQQSRAPGQAAALAAVATPTLQCQA